MSQPWKSRFQFRLRDILAIFLGVAIGYSLNLAARLLTERPGQPSMVAFPTYVIEPPDILTIESNGEFTDKLPSISGKHLVGMDGRINLGAFGSVYVAGLTISEAQSAIQKIVGRQVALRNVTVDVFAYNSKTYYVITQGSGNVHNVAEFPVTGNETVLDAIANLGGVPKDGRLWISRPAHNGVGKETILPVAWNEISAGKSTSTNHQLWPRDRLYIDNRTKNSKAN